MAKTLTVVLERYQITAAVVRFNPSTNDIEHIEAMATRYKANNQPHDQVSINLTTTFSEFEKQQLKGILRRAILQYKQQEGVD